MCGIAFIYNDSGNAAECSHRISEALKKMQHRGPDGSGTFQYQNAFLGHVRLSIIDLDLSIQPFISNDERYALIFNGEIYNYKALRNSFEGRWAFRTGGDTEVLLAGLILEGTHFLNKMEGMWAFCYWDNHTETALLCRDRSGKKPLFFRQNQKKLTCASELPALRQLDADSWQVSPESQVNYFKYGYCSPGKTFYQEIQEIKPGHYLYWKKNAVPQQERYWSIETQRFTGSKVEAAEKIRELFKSSVKKRLVSDVEVGTFLSGGIDSSLVTAQASKLTTDPIKAFTIGYDDQVSDERPFAKVIAENLNIDHQTYCLKQWNPNILEKLLNSSIGQPFADSSILPSYEVSKMAAKYVKVALSGDGSDELFCGYTRYKVRAILKWYLHAPNFFRKKFKLLLSRSVSDHFQRKRFYSFIYRILNVIECLEDETPYKGGRVFSNQKILSLLNTYQSIQNGVSKNEEVLQSFDEVASMMKSDFLNYLPQDIHQKVDRASMFCSLEIRAPFLDSELIQHAFSLPESWHYGNTQNKPMLRLAFKNLLPQVIWNRKKQGFVPPVQEWLMGDLGGELRALLYSDRESLLNRGVVDQMLNDHKAGVLNHTYRLWLVYVYLLWNNKHLSSFSTSLNVANKV